MSIFCCILNPYIVNISIVIAVRAPWHVWGILHLDARITYIRIYLRNIRSLTDYCTHISFKCMKFAYISLEKYTNKNTRLMCSVIIEWEVFCASKLAILSGLMIGSIRHTSLQGAIKPCQNIQADEAYGLFDAHTLEWTIYYENSRNGTWRIEIRFKVNMTVHYATINITWMKLWIQYYEQTTISMLWNEMKLYINI